MNDNKQHTNELKEAFECAHETVEAAAFSMWQAQGLINSLSLINRSGFDGVDGQQMFESLLSALSEKIGATHQMLSQLETQMLHKITN